MPWRTPGLVILFFGHRAHFNACRGRRHPEAKFLILSKTLTFAGQNAQLSIGIEARQAGTSMMVRLPDVSKRLTPVSRRGCIAFGVAAAALALAACTGSSFNDALGPQPAPPVVAGPPPGNNNIGSGQIRVALILPLSAQGNAGVAAQSMKNAAEMALAEFREPNIQLLVKDDAGAPQGAQAAAQQAMDEGAEIIVGPLFAQSVSAVGSVARPRNIPVIAFSTDASVAARGVYLLSFLPETDVRRIVEFSVSRGKRSFAALLPDNAYGAVVEAAFQQEVAKRGGRVVALEKYPIDQNKMAEAIKRVARAANRADSIFIPDGADAVPQVVAGLAANGVNLKRVQLLGTGLWDEQRIFSTPALDGGWYAAPEQAGFRNFATRYRARFGQEPVRTATLAYDAVALVAALVKTQGPQRFAEPVLTNPSGFAGIDGVFRFRSDGTNDRGLAILRVSPQGGQPISPAPRVFNPGT
jgi:ABC-type branched-subunit amino acid transport system substrate-binding protein